MKHTVAFAALLLSSVALVAQSAGISYANQPKEIAAVSLMELPEAPSAVKASAFVATSASALPDGPDAAYSSSSVTEEGTHADDAQLFSSPGSMAPKYATVILPGQTAAPLHGMEKAKYGVADVLSPWLLLGETLSAGYSHLIQSAPHYGTDAPAFGEREGAAIARGTIQTLSTDAVFAPMFHDDPRYYVLGQGHSFGQRFRYAATRVLETRSSHSMDQRLNAPLMLGYLVTAGANNLYYPPGDRTPSKTFSSFGYSLIGAALGFEVDEFLDDALKMVHIRKQ